MTCACKVFTVFLGNTWAWEVSFYRMILGNLVKFIVLYSMVVFMLVGAGVGSCLFL